MKFRDFSRSEKPFSVRMTGILAKSVVNFVPILLEDQRFRFFLFKETNQPDTNGLNVI